MSADEQLVVYLEARVREFEKRMKSAERTGTRSYTGLERGSKRATAAMERDMVRSTSRINQAIASTSTKLGTFGRAFAGGLIAGGVSAASTAIVRGVRETTRELASLGDEAKRAGLNLEAYQEFKFIAEQNRIGIDSMVDGFKELNLRADEFVVTGKGPAAEAFKRLGYTADQLAKELKAPDELMLKIIGRLGDLDRAAQIRVADEVFGGSAGERFVELIQQGEGALRRTADRAHELGRVLDTEAIEKAQELDRRFNELAGRLTTLGQSLAVGLGDVFVQITTLRTELSDVFDSMEQARSVLGDGPAAALEADAEAMARNRAEAEALATEYHILREQALGLTGPLYQNAAALRDIGENRAADALIDVAEGIDVLAGKLKDGTVSADDFEEQILALAQEANVAIGEVQAIDKVTFQGVTSSLNGFVVQLGAAIARARELRAALPGSNPGGATETPVYGSVGARSDPRQFGSYRERSENAPTSSTRPTRAPFEIGVPDLPTRGRSSGGGGSGLDAFSQAIEDTRADIRELEAEAAVLVVLAESGRNVGDALEYARKRAELMNDALASGKKITPELQAEIDALAESYARAGDNAEAAADRIQDADAKAEQGAERLSDIFGSILDGSKSAKDAVKELLLEIAKVQVAKRLTGFFKSSGIGEAFAGLFDSGGHIPSGKFGIVGERGPEIVTGPANVTSRAQTARALKAPATGGNMGLHVTLSVAADGLNLEPAVKSVAMTEAITAIQGAAPAMIAQATSKATAATRAQMQKSKKGFN